MPVPAIRQTFSGTASDATLPMSVPDRVMSVPAFDQGGIRHLFDHNNPATGLTGAPTNGQPIVDVSAHENGAFTFTGTGTLAYSGGGIDFSGVANVGATLDIPASVAADIWGNGTVPQYFLQGLYVKLPTKAQWVTAIRPLSCFTTASNGFQSEADLVTIAMVVVGATPYLRVIRQLSLGPATVDQFDIPLPDSVFGTVVQIGFWRNAAGQMAQLVWSAGSLQVAKTVNANNIADFSTKKGKIGIGTSFWNNADTMGKTWRLYRGFIENLRTSGRDPAAVLAADWKRVQARAVFS
ncbi:hypothetical protein [Methylorubrum rhodesianum]|uniref:hypothetical protein n=1 Tax=Methylorubrum rhodesianum TaxID=29427 RepID=UPI00374738BA